jgi:hypothetical protein
MISERAKAALAGAKRRGVKLGGDRGARLTQKARRAGTEEIAPGERRSQLRPRCARDKERGVHTPRGVGKWKAGSVAQLLGGLPDCR